MGKLLEPEAERAAQLHPRVVHALNGIASELSELGLELFLFGSVAQTYPYTRRGADLDLGLRTVDNLTPHLQLERKRYATSRLQALPTIRPVDIVDFDEVGERFKNLAMETRLEFPLSVNGSDNRREPERL